MRRETVRKTSRLHQWDVLRANKAPFAFGLEPRVPFLDKDFVAAAMGVDPAAKMVRWRLLCTLCCEAPGACSIAGGGAGTLCPCMGSKARASAPPAGQASLAAEPACDSAGRAALTPSWVCRST